MLVSVNYSFMGNISDRNFFKKEKKKVKFADILDPDLPNLLNYDSVYY